MIAFLKNSVAMTPAKKVIVQQYAVIFFCVLAVTLYHRAAALDVYYRLIAFAEIFPRYDGFKPKRGFLQYFGASILNGLRADVIFCLLASSAALFFSKNIRILAFILLALLYAGNVEHIKYNYTNINLSLLTIGFDSSFLQAHLSKDFFKVFLTSLALGCLIYYLTRIKPVRVATNVVAIIAFILVVLPVYSLNIAQPQWLQAHPLLPTSGSVEVTTDNRLFEATLFNAPVELPDLESQRPKRNLLIIYMEGLGRISIEKGDMEYLQSLEKNNRTYTRYFGHQLTTANGLYSSLTGKLPHFISKEFRWDDIATRGSTEDPALPEILKNAGYQTSFVQSAPLSFMSKGKILPMLGFDNVLGEEHHPRNQPRNGWGIDDKSLFKNVLTHIDSLSTDSPWMVGALTTGTHSPYFFPNDFLPEHNNARYQALRYLDEALFELLEGLQTRNLMENTVVVITSDESRELPGYVVLENEVALGWLPLILISPDSKPESYDQYMMSSELPIIILKALGIESDKWLNRKKDIIIFGNILNNRLIWFDITKQELLACNTRNFICGLYENVSDLTNLENIQPIKKAYFPMLEQLIQQHE